MLRVYPVGSNDAAFNSGGGVLYTGLLSTIFSGQITSYTNSGSGGGTAYYLNIGGFKINWGIFANFINTYNQSSLGVTFQTAYSQTPSCGAWQNSATNDGRNLYQPNGASTTGFSIMGDNRFNNTNATGQPGWYAIGI